MGTLVFNIAKGRVAELYNRVDTNDPSTSGLKIVPVDRGATTDATMMDYATLSAVLGGVTERTSNGWNRKTLTDTELGAMTVDNSADRMPLDLPDQTWTAVGAGGGAITDLIIAYFPDTAGADSTGIPLTCHAFAITPDGSDVVATVTDFYRAS